MTGGFALACEWAGIETICFCEIDKFCQKILNKHWPGIPIVEDINNVEEIKAIADSNGGIQRGITRQTKRQLRWQDKEALLLTAGFPCQPFSNAGRKRGASDDRYLWPQTLAVVQSIKPDWCIFENVPGILNMVFPDSGVKVASQASLFSDPNDEIADYRTISGGIDHDLRQAGYETVWLVIPACSLGAPHRRDRVWIVANSNRPGNGTPRSGINTNWPKEITGQRNQTQPKYIGQDSHAPNSARQQEHTTGTRGLHALSGSEDSHASNATEQGLEGAISEGAVSTGCVAERSAIPGWQENWYEAATRLCTLDDGLPGGLARPKGWRVNALKAAGNAIVPQIAYELIKSIAPNLVPGVSHVSSNENA